MVVGHNINDGRRTEDIKISQDVTFETMLLRTNTLKGLKDSGFYKPSPIQLHAIPLGKCGFDLLLEAKSGTGKTAVFTVIALEKIDLEKGLQVIILAPTREIAMQIHDVVKEIGAKYQGLQVEVVMGGLSVQDDIEKFKKPVHIVVGSPGRVKHLIKDKFIDTSSVRMLVLDEADKLMEKSFQSDIKYINSTLPQQKQIIMSSATYPESSKTFIQEYVQNAQHICPDTNNVLLGIEQKVTLVKYNSNIVKQTDNKFMELLKILSHKQFKQGLIFCNYQSRVVEIHKMLRKEGWPAEQLYGLQGQTDRLDALKILQEYKCRLLISTDLAARGIDASNVDLVINFEPPYEWPTYLHRIGRAGRFGSYGTAITILSEGEEEKKFKNLLESISHPFNLTYLWSNDKFSLQPIENGSDPCPLIENGEQYDNTVSEENISIEDNDIKLWTALTNDMKLKKPLENFESLCMAFNGQEDDSEIEIFNNLLQSFESSEDNIGEENEFVKIELLELPINDSNIDSSKLCKNINNNNLKSILNKELIEKCHLDDTKEEDKELTENREKTILNSNIVTELSKLETDLEEVISPINSYKKENGICENNSKLYNNAIDNNANFQNDYEITNKTFVELGLPTSFSSSKWSHNTRNKIDTENNYSNQLYCRDTDKQISNKKSTKLNKIKGKAKADYGYDIKSSHAKESFRKYKNSIIDNWEPQKKSSLQSNGKVIDKPKETYDKRYLANVKKGTLHKEHNKQDYVNWYNALKLKMKQIEFLVYFNEINK